MIPAIMGLSAVQEFVQRGGGTPIPYDAPRRLVTSGPYAYVANPMQLSMAIVLTIWGFIIGEPWVSLGGPMAFVYSAGIAAWDESSDLTGRFGEAWKEYRRHVRPWILRLRPYHGGAAARLYVAETCGPCSEVAAWFAQRMPTGLEIVPAELHPHRDLNRITYDPGDGGREEEGVAAIARALEHVHLGWAAVGWMLRLPGLRAVLQLVVDASGGEPRLIPRRPSAEVACARR
jgi:hypothetical protein